MSKFTDSIKQGVGRAIGVGLVVGAIGLTDRMNRDAFRVLSGGVLLYITGSYRKRSSAYIEKMGKIKIKGIMPGYLRANIVYAGGGTAPTLLARDYKDPIKVLRKWKRKRLG